MQKHYVFNKARGKLDFSQVPKIWDKHFDYLKKIQTKKGIEIQPSSWN